MTTQKIKDKIEQEFGWLSPDEKQKLNSLMISVWNDAVVASASLVNDNRMSLEFWKDGSMDKSFMDEWMNPSKCKDAINALKLKL